MLVDLWVRNVGRARVLLACLWLLLRCFFSGGGLGLLLLLLFLHLLNLLVLRSIVVQALHIDLLVVQILGAQFQRIALFRNSGLFWLRLRLWRGLRLGRR